MRLTKKYMSVYFKHNNETYEIRVYAVKENEGPAERYDLMIFKDFKKVSLFVYSIDMTTHPKFKQAWLDPEPALKYLIDLAMKDIRFGNEGYHRQENLPLCPGKVHGSGRKETGEVFV